MKKLSFENLDLDEFTVLQRNQLKTVFGGRHSACANDAEPALLEWSCTDGTSGSGYICMEHLQAYQDMVVEFCS